MRKPDCLLVRVGELALKSKQVQRRFFSILLNNIRAGLNEKKIKFNFEINPNRIFIYTKQIKKAIKILQKIFGITSISPVWTCYSNLNEMRILATAIAKHIKLNKNQSFAIRARRAGKHEFSSQTIAEEAGGAVKRLTGVKVNLTAPEKEIFIECRSRKTYIFTEKVQGPGGLPLGTGGNVVCLFSGGIDSAVAAWLVAKRGCELVLLYADIMPFTDKANLKRGKKVLKALKPWHIGKKLKCYKFSHGKNLKEFVKCKNITCILCKRQMYRIAEEIAKKEHARAIVTGENLAQVASQTLTNLAVIDQAISTLVLRPLIGFDKEDIVNLAKEIGTYESSILPIMSCKAVPSKPATRANIKDVLSEEGKINIKKLTEQSLGSIKQLN